MRSSTVISPRRKSETCFPSPPKTTSLAQWSRRLSEHSQSNRLGEEFEYWRNARPEGLGYCAPRDITGGVNDVASTSTVSVSLGVEETVALFEHVLAVAAMPAFFELKRGRQRGPQFGPRP